MISHIFIGITDHTRAHAFYSAIMDELGYVLKFCYPERSWSGWVEQGTVRPIVGIGKPFNGEDMSPGNGQMLALLAKSRKLVDAKVRRVCGRIIIPITTVLIFAIWMAIRFVFVVMRPRVPSF